jgi:hypothetical protein
MASGAAGELSVVASGAAGELSVERKMRVKRAREIKEEDEGTGGCGGGGRTKCVHV